MDLDAALTTLARDPAAPCDVAELALHLARDEYPHLDVDGYLADLAAMAREARDYLRGGPEARLAGLCRYLFHEQGFHGNTRNYYDPLNSYLNQVFDRRTGIPISLSVLTMAVGRRAGLEVVGVGLPGHFVAKAVQDGTEMLFDPFHGGRRLTPEDCRDLAQEATGTPQGVTPALLAATPPGLIALRMLSNLKGVYLKDGDFRRAARVIERLRQLAPGDLLQRRDLGVCLLQAGQPGRAIGHLTAYLAAAPGGGDAEEVRRLLERARGEVAKWN